MQKRDVHEYDFELSIGDILQIGESQITLIDIDGSDASFRIDSDNIPHDANLRHALVPR